MSPAPRSGLEPVPAFKPKPFRIQYFSWLEVIQYSEPVLIFSAFLIKRDKRSKMKASFNDNNNCLQIFSVQTQEALRKIVIKYLDYFYPKWVFSLRIARCIFMLLITCSSILMCVYFFLLQCDWDEQHGGYRQQDRAGYGEWIFFKVIHRFRLGWSFKNLFTCVVWSFCDNVLKKPGSLQNIIFLWVKIKLNVILIGYFEMQLLATDIILNIREYSNLRTYTGIREVKLVASFVVKYELAVGIYAPLK